MSPIKSEHVYRVDKFVVPSAGRDEFIGWVQRTHEVLRAQPGFLQDFVLEQFSGPGEFNFVTVVEWESQAAIEHARPLVMAMHASNNFDPREMYARLGIRADIANYRQVDA
jgi:Antibiotic biosynthesis monooxygenase